MNVQLVSLLAQTDPALLVQIGSSVLVGLGVYALIRTVANTMRSSDVEQDDSWQYDVTRINELRRVSSFYRIFYPLLILLARMNTRLFPGSMPVIARQLQTAGMPRSWTPPEFLARCQLIGLLLLPAYLFLAIRNFGQTGAVIAVVASLMTMILLRRRLATRAQYRLFKIKQRMPFLLDLLTLLMEAGSTFLLALEEAVKEFHDHPVGIEFGRVLAEMSMGKSRTAAFESMKERLNDHEITSIVGSIIQGETLGTPLARLFRTQADVLRVKRTQRAETIAGEAGVKMLAPAVLVMAATVIIILGPFLLGFIYTDYMMR
jgi:tight adherence protein C